MTLLSLGWKPSGTLLINNSMPFLLPSLQVSPFPTFSRFQMGQGISGSLLIPSCPSKSAKVGETQKNKLKKKAGVMGTAQLFPMACPVNSLTLLCLGVSLELLMSTSGGWAILKLRNQC